jgi:phosphomannomutase
MLRGDELGVIFGEWIARDNSQGNFGNSIVSSSALQKIAAHYSIGFKEVLTGFKWIAKIEDLAFGYEEAIGYAVDSKTVNDKDGISAALLLAHIASELKSQGLSLLDLLNEVWARHGFHGTEQISIRVAEMSQITQLLAGIRKNPPSHIADRAVLSIDDLADPQDGLPPTDGLRLWIDGGIRMIVRPSGTEAKMKCTIIRIPPSIQSRRPSVGGRIRMIVRPSGTEAKMKCYIEVIAKDEAMASDLLDQLRQPIKEFLA